jgi:hypothetical protein
VVFFGEFMDKNGPQKAKTRQEKAKNGKKRPRTTKRPIKVTKKQKVAKMAKKSEFSLTKMARNCQRNRQKWPKIVKHITKVAKIVMNIRFCHYGKMN